jgi:hypothetical protein
MEQQEGRSSMETTEQQQRQPNQTPESHPSPPSRKQQGEGKLLNRRESRKTRPKSRSKATEERERRALKFGKILVNFLNAKSPDKAVKALELRPRSGFPYSIVDQHKRSLNKKELKEYQECHMRLDRAICFFMKGGKTQNSRAFSYFDNIYHASFENSIQTRNDGATEEIEVYTHRYRKSPRKKSPPTFVEALSYCVFNFFRWEESVQLIGKCQNQFRKVPRTKDKYEPCRKFFLAEREGRRRQFCGTKCQQAQNRISKRMKTKARGEMEEGDK